MDVIKAYEDAYKDELRIKVETEVLSQYGMTRKQFLKEGRESFGDEEFIEILRQMTNTELETDSLVGGFQEDDSPILFSIHHPGANTIHGSGFHAIGSGATLANASLMTKADLDGSMLDIVYRVLEAKFNGESALGVGKKTAVVVASGAGEWMLIPPNDTGPIRGLWEKIGRPPVSQEARNLISDALISTGRFTRPKE